MLLVHLIRHAESTANVDTIIGGVDATLTPKGIAQAETLGAYVSRTAAITLDAVYSSPYPRARATARYVCDAVKYMENVTLDQRLVEIDRGEWDGRRISDVITDEVRAEMQRLGLDYKTPGGESMRDVGQRMYLWLRQVKQVHAINIAPQDPWHPHTTSTATRSVAAFTHGHAIRCLINHLFGFDASALRFMRVDNTSITTLRWNGEVWGLDCLNSRPHLA